jgi:RNA polymerase sigma-70 factor (ECF subfamily)
MGLFKSNKEPETSDEELITSYRFSHDTKYIGELYQRYTSLVFGVCMKYLKDPMEAEDAVMQIFEKLMEDLKRHEVDYFKGWLHMVARNHCLMKLRKDQTSLKRESGYQNHQQTLMESGESIHLNDEAAEKEQVLELMHLHLSDLKEEQKTCIELFYLKDKSYKEVAEMTGFSLKEVKSHIQNGKRNLRNKMTDEGSQGG